MDFLPRLLIASDFTEFYFPIQEEEEDFNTLLEEYFFKTISMEGKWGEKVMLRKNIRKCTDFFELIESGIITISERVYKDVKELNENIEFLPIKTDEGNYYAINVKKFTDCLDKEKSIFTLSDTGCISSYKYLKFIDEPLANQLFFKIKELPYRLFCTEKFLSFYDQKDYNGLDLSLV